MKWWKISFILCTYGFFKEYRPSEPFITPFLTDFKNFTIDEVNKEMFPVGTYSYLSLLIVIFLLTDLFRYKPILIIGGMSAVITWSLLIWGTTMREMQAVEFFYGLFMASEIAYFSYIYTKVDKKHYQKVTSHTRVAFLLGKAGAGLSSQILVYFNFNFLELNYFTLFGVGATLPTTFFLPSVPQSLYFHHKEIKDELGEEAVSREGDESNEVQNWPQCKFNFYIKAFSLLYKDFKENFQNFYVICWSIWWALATCGYLQVVSYCQLLWQDIIQVEDTTLLHGYVEFVVSVLGAAVAFGVGYINIPWNIWGGIFFGVLTISQGGFLIYSAYLMNLYIAYATYIIYKLLYDAGITIVTCEIAKHIREDCYGLVFGINTFAALGVQTSLTAIVINTLEISIRTQFKIYGGYHLFIGSAFFFYGLWALITSRKNMSENN